jgi:hypothetical protein
MSGRSRQIPNPLYLGSALLAAAGLVVLAQAFGVDFRIPQTPERLAAAKAREEFMVRKVCAGELLGPPYYSEELCKSFPPRPRH